MAQWELNFTLINPKTKLLETQKTPGITTPINYSRAQMARTSNCTVIKPKWMIFKQIFDLLQNFTSCWNSNDNFQVQRAEIPVPGRVLFAGLCQESWRLNPCLWWSQGTEAKWENRTLKKRMNQAAASSPGRKWHPWSSQSDGSQISLLQGSCLWFLAPQKLLMANWGWGGVCLSVCLSGSSEMHKLKTGEQTDGAL